MHIESLKEKVKQYIQDFDIPMFGRVLKQKNVSFNIRNEIFLNGEKIGELSENGLYMELKCPMPNMTIENHRYEVAIDGTKVEECRSYTTGVAEDYSMLVFGKIRIDGKDVAYYEAHKSSNKSFLSTREGAVLPNLSPRIKLDLPQHFRYKADEGWDYAEAVAIPEKENMARVVIRDKDGNHKVYDEVNYVVGEHGAIANAIAFAPAQEAENQLTGRKL